MPHFFSINLQQGGHHRPCFFIYCIYCAMLFTQLLVSMPALAAEEGAGQEKFLINGLDATQNKKNLEISIHCSAPFDARPLRLTNPERIVVDITDGEIEPGVQLTLPKNFDIEVSYDELTQDVIEFTLSQLYVFSSKWNGNDLVLTLEDFFTEEQALSEEKSDLPSSPAEGKDSTGVFSLSAPKEKRIEKETIDRHLPDMDMSDVLSSVAGTGADTAGSTEGTKSGEQASSAIGDTETISVDFYKIDLHNVFRMLREITGKNIVIAGGVSGNLTLALTDVPWRFALDIILNLKNLAKMERGNTIVIYPKSKEFVWPEQENEDISVIENEEITKAQKERGVTITGEANVPPEQLEAKKLIANGRAAEKKGDLETAVRFYERALGKWPENTKLANKISTTYLAKLNQNAKAVFFAKKALKADKKNTAAALNAAIGYANMEEYRQAQQYFDQSVNAGKPSREALISYAAFSERQRQYDAALRLLKKLEDLYGQDLNSMIAQARIYDSLGDYGAARKAYKAILNAGFRVPPDLKKFILSKTGNN
ncbi:AMIN domain-containing protein [Candidatus Electrothrix laxa]